MQKLKLAFKILLYFSMGFVVYYLARFDYLSLSVLHFNYLELALSVVLLWLGFYTSTQSWRTCLQAHNTEVSVSLSVYSHGISVFAKYIPGKIWVILGRASIVSEEKGSLAVLSAISLKEQLVYLFLGLLISLCILPFMPINYLITLIVAFTAIGLGLFLFTRLIHNFCINLLFKLVKKKPDIPFVNFKKAFSFSWIILLYWMLWSIGFYFLVHSAIPKTSILVAFAFPVSVCYGLIAVVVPGGIGVRESILVMLLTAMGVSPTMAVSISVVQRLWFISGEVFIFVLALILKRFK